MYAIRISVAGTPLTVASLYCSPSFKTSLEEFLEVFCQLDGSWIIGGDFNSKHLMWASR
ncbi:hypothetical protein PGB90_003922 [Kerria lacca]